jgi:ubiquinone/menaquinone biosynthesis C-methylase UbiE
MTNSWLYNDMQQIGMDYEDFSNVELYNKRMSKIRDIEGEIKDIFNAFKTDEQDTILEFGAGTGEVAIALAHRCKTFIAVDVSKVMLNYAKKKAGDKEIDNVQFIQGSFLTYKHTGEPVDAVITQIALHHLPDFWKQVALQRIYTVLKESGKLYIRDVVYSFRIEEYEEKINKWISDVQSVAGDEIGSDIQSHIREEYSTFDWIMRGIIEKAGFTIENSKAQSDFISTYVCTKA